MLLYLRKVWESPLGVLVHEERPRHHPREPFPRPPLNLRTDAYRKQHRQPRSSPNRHRGNRRRRQIPRRRIVVAAGKRRGRIDRRRKRRKWADSEVAAAKKPAPRSGKAAASSVETSSAADWARMAWTLGMNESGNGLG